MPLQAFEHVLYTVTDRVWCKVWMAELRVVLVALSGSRREESEFEWRHRSSRFASITLNRPATLIGRG